MLSLQAAITATYVPAPYLAFTSVFPGYSRPPDFPPFADANFVAHLGTLTIEATGGDVLYQPSLINSQISSRFQFNGPVNWNGNTNPIWKNLDTGFALVAVTSELGTTGYQALWGGSGTVPLTDSQAAINGSTFIAKFYFIGDQSSNIYKPGAIYTLSSGSTGAFNVAVAPNSAGIYNQQANNIRVPVGSQTIPPGGGITPESPVLVLPGTPPLPYEDPANPILTVGYDFSIINRQGFSLSAGYTGNFALIAKAQLILSNPTAGTTYGVSVQFSKLPGSSAFELRPDGFPSGYVIPYQLKFLGQIVVKDVAIPWTPLATGVNTQDILVTGISSTTAGGAPSGAFMDTIVVTVTPI